MQLRPFKIGLPHFRYSHPDPDSDTLGSEIIAYFRLSDEGLIIKEQW
jgi:hypothetical protein